MEKEYCYKTNEKVYNNGIEVTLHVDFIKSASGKTMQPLQVHISTPSGCFSTDYIFVAETTTLKDVIEDLLDYYSQE